MRVMTEQDREDRIQSIIGSMALAGIHVTYAMAAEAVDRARGKTLCRVWREDDDEDVTDAALRARH